MIRRAVVMMGVCCLYGARAESAEGYAFGPLAAHLSSQEKAAIWALVVDEAAGPPAGIFARHSQVLPEVWSVNVFLRPTAVSPRVRRGPVAHLECSPVPGSGTCTDWKVRKDRAEYVQVALKSSGFGGDARPEAERPITFTGTLSDAQLLSLVTYLRTGPGPKHPDGSLGISVPLNKPIMAIHEQGGAVVAELSSDGISGETATIEPASGGWRVVSVLTWAE
jgi:hypothetical protein